MNAVNTTIEGDLEEQGRNRITVGGLGCPRFLLFVDGLKRELVEHGRPQQSDG